MSEVSDKVAAINTGLADVKTQLTGLGEDLTQEIKEIGDKIAAGGGVTPEDLAGLTEVATGLTEVSTTIQGVRDQVKGIVTP